PEVTHGVLKEKAMLIYTQYFQATT
ncbi:nucleoside deaminase, partial [Providencia stuartii]|nr:nucleoside deaminase [Providencia stuartii]